jgi:short-subunit dehydrogenase
MSTSRSSQLLARYGPLAVVTGASSGIGRAIAVELAAAGFDLLLVARHEPALRTLAGELASAHDTRREFTPLAADVGTPAGLAAVIAASRELDVGLLVASAGFGTAGEFIAADLETELNLIDVNCRAPLVLAHHFGGLFAARGRGGLVLFGSLVGFQGAPRAAHYAATKAYIQTLAEGLHHELKPRGVDVLACAPGPVRSGFATRSGMRMAGTDLPAQVARGTLAALGRRMTATPGPLSKFLTASLMTAPRFLRVRIMGKIMGDMTRHLP